MSKKIMLLALTVVSAALFILPAMTTAAEIHIEGATGKTATASAAGGNFVSSGEPTITCMTLAASGSFTSETTVSVDQSYGGCSTTILGVTLHCRTTTEGTGVIKTSNVFHLITIDTISKPGILMTPPFSTVICGEGFSERKLQVDGNGAIGTVTSPACGGSSSSMTISFSAPGASQEHKLYTGTSYQTSTTTEGS